MLEEQDPIDRTLAVVRTQLIEIVDPTGEDGLVIELDTAFDADLELESLEFVALAERLRRHYGEHVDFVAWLAAMELDEIIALTVGDLVAFVASTLATLTGQPLAADEMAPRRDGEPAVALRPQPLAADA